MLCMLIVLAQINMTRREDTIFAVKEKNQRPIWEKMWKMYIWMYENEMKSEDACDWYIKGDDEISRL